MPQVYLRNHSPLWQWKFLKEKVLLRTWLRGQVLDIEHFGSTSIPGMIAKPIIDIQIGVRDFQRAFKCVEQIEQLGYAYKGEKGELRQYYFTKGNPVGYHLYVVEKSSETWDKRTAFRDYLKNNRESANKYAELKQELASRYPDDSRAYQDGKLELVGRIVLVAKREKRTIKNAH